MEYVSGLFCAANYSCVRCACVDDLDETDDFDRLRAYAVSRLGAPPDGAPLLRCSPDFDGDTAQYVQIVPVLVRRRGWHRRGQQRRPQRFTPKHPYPVLLPSCLCPWFSLYGTRLPPPGRPVHDSTAP